MTWRWDERALEHGINQSAIQQEQQDRRLKAVVWLEDEYVRSVLQVKIRSAGHRRADLEPHVKIISMLRSNLPDGSKAACSVIKPVASC